MIKNTFSEVAFSSQWRRMNMSRIVAGGGHNLRVGTEAKAREIVVARYADQWLGASWIQRWKLRRSIEIETKTLNAEMLAEVSDRAVF